MITEAGPRVSTDLKYLQSGRLDRLMERAYIFVIRMEPAVKEPRKG